MPRSNGVGTWPRLYSWKHHVNDQLVYLNGWKADESSAEKDFPLSQPWRFRHVFQCGSLNVLDVHIQVFWPNKNMLWLWVYEILLCLKQGLCIHVNVSQNLVFQNSLLAYPTFQEFPGFYRASITLRPKALKWVIVIGGSGFVSFLLLSGSSLSSNPSQIDKISRIGSKIRAPTIQDGPPTIVTLGSLWIELWEAYKWPYKWVTVFFFRPEISGVIWAPTC